LVLGEGTSNWTDYCCQFIHPMLGLSHGSIMPSVPLIAVRVDEESPRIAMWRGCVLLACIALAASASLAGARAGSMEHPMIFGHALLAFFLGLRHAVDCDHLASIDNVTRRLVSKGQRPVSVGFWFAAGHSTVVVALTMVVACGYS